MRIPCAQASARIVTNERYRDGMEDHPELHIPGQPIQGDYASGTLGLDISQA